MINISWGYYISYLNWISNFSRYIFLYEYWHRDNRWMLFYIFVRTRQLFIQHGIFLLFAYNSRQYDHIQIPFFLQTAQKSIRYTYIHITSFVSYFSHRQINVDFLNIKRFEIVNKRVVSDGLSFFHVRMKYIRAPHIFSITLYNSFREKTEIFRCDELIWYAQHVLFRFYILDSKKYV